MSAAQLGLWVKAMHNRYFIARLYVAISVLLTALAVMFDPTSIHSQAAYAAKLPDTLFIGALLVCSIAILDTFVNDILPNKYKFKQAYDFRHVIYMALALISFSLSAGLLVTFGGSILVGRLWLDSLVATVVAVLDIFARHRGQK